VKDNGHKYFINLLSDNHIPSDFKGMAAFVLAMIVRNYQNGQEAAFQGNLIATCLEQLCDPCPLLRKWCCICLGLVWDKFDAAYWRGVRDLAHEKLLCLLQSEEDPEVRAAAVFALGTFIHSASDRTDQPNAIDLQVGIGLLGSKVDTSLDGSPIVRKELLVALQWLVMLFENQFITLQAQYEQEEKLLNGSPAGQYCFNFSHQLIHVLLDCL
jgi:regulator-associated protein of mTOR